MGEKRRADHRRALLGRHPRLLHRPRRPRGGRRRPDRAGRGRRHDRASTPRPGTIELEVDEAVLAERRKAWQPRGHDYNVGRAVALCAERRPGLQGRGDAPGREGRNPCLCGHLSAGARCCCWPALRARPDAADARCRSGGARSGRPRSTMRAATAARRPSRARRARVEREPSSAATTGLVLVVRHPDGGFRRFEVLADGTRRRHRRRRRARPTVTLRDGRHRGRGRRRPLPLPGDDRGRCTRR